MQFTARGQVADWLDIAITACSAALLTLLLSPNMILGKTETMEKMAALVFRFIVFTAEIPRPHGRWPHPVARCRLGHFRITPELGLRGAVAGGHTGL